MEEITIDDMLNVLCLRNQLSFVPLKDLMKVYEDYECYLTFVDSVVVLTQVDSAFLLFSDEFLEKIVSIIQIHRYDTENDEVKQIVSDIIGYVNRVRAYKKDYKILLMKQYWGYNEDIRNIKFDTPGQLLSALSYDAVVCASLENDSMDDVHEDQLFLSSINYLLETMPDIFKDEGMNTRALNKIRGIEKKSKLFKNKIKSYAKSTKNAFQKVRLKEEY